MTVLTCAFPTCARYDGEKFMDRFQPHDADADADAAGVVLVAAAFSLT